jgi:hypothetical protein
MYPSYNDKVAIHRTPAQVIVASIPKYSGKNTTTVRLNQSFEGEHHFPGYQYLGPGTNLETRLALGIKPITDLDRIAMYHDIDYSSDASQSRMGLTRAMSRAYADLGAGSAMITYGLNPYSDAPLALSIVSGSYLIGQGLSRINPYTMIPVGVLDAIFL